MRSRKQSVNSPSTKWQDIPTIKIEPEEIIYLVEQMQAPSRGSTDNGGGFFASMAILGNRYRGEKNCVDRMFCIQTRMECLAGLMKDDRMRGWTMETNDPKWTVTNGAIFHATALCPLLIESGRFHFNPDEFSRIALEVAEPEGRA
jgi:hypothetical protein